MKKMKADNKTRAKTRAKQPKAEERKTDWELTSVSHGSHDDWHDSHDSLARWLAVCQDPLLAVVHQNSANSPKTLQNGLRSGQTTKNTTRQ